VNWILDLDLKGFFDNIDPELLMEMIERRIADPRILRLIRKWLKAGVIEDGEWSETEKGTPLTRGKDDWRPSEELTPRSPGISRLRGYGFLDFDKLVPSGLSLSLQFGFESLLPLGVFLCPDGCVVFDLLLQHRVEDDRDFVSRRSLGCRWSDFALHPAQVICHRAELVMQTESRHAE